MVMLSYLNAAGSASVAAAGVGCETVLLGAGLGVRRVGLFDSSMSSAPARGRSE